MISIEDTGVRRLRCWRPPYVYVYGGFSAR
jgi:hypothetical protein